MRQIRSWMGRYQVDQMCGHTAGVRSCRLLPSHGLLATGGCPNHACMPVYACMYTFKLCRLTPGSDSVADSQSPLVE
jgi:hypothetical protein